MIFISDIAVFGLTNVIFWQETLGVRHAGRGVDVQPLFTSMHVPTFIDMHSWRKKRWWHPQ